MLYVPVPPSSPLCLHPSLLRSLAPWAESRQNATCAGWQAFPETQTTAALLLLFLLLFPPPPPAPLTNSGRAAWALKN